MPTNKKRLNISLSKDLEEVLEVIAKRDKVPQSTKAVELLKLALEIEEDAALAAIAKERDTPDAIFVSHEHVWRGLSN